MKTLTPEQRIEGFTELEGVLGEGGVGGAHLMSFLAGIAHAEKVLAEPKQDEEPEKYGPGMIGFIQYIPDAGMSFTLDEPDDDSYPFEPVYTHPAPRPDFVRLSEEEVNEILSLAHTPYEAICATENMLVRKNTINKSDPDSIDLQSKCRGDKL